MQLTYLDKDLPAGTICTQRLQQLVQFAEYRVLVRKCKTYCQHRNIDINNYIDDPRFIGTNAVHIYFLPIPLAISIVESLRNNWPSRDHALTALHSYTGSSNHVNTVRHELAHILHKTFKLRVVHDYNLTIDDTDVTATSFIPQYNIILSVEEECSVSSRDGYTFVHITDTTDLTDTLSLILPLCCKPL